MTTKMDLKSYAAEYFSKLNPIAEKINIDINETVEAYEYLWNELSAKEKMDVINDQLIKPEISMKYFDKCTSPSSSSSSSSLIRKKSSNKETVSENADGNAIGKTYHFDGKHLITYKKLKTGMKINQDDVCGVYRDEHSGPFNCRTKSQINLNLFDLEMPPTPNHNNIIQQQQQQQSQSQQPPTHHIETISPKASNGIANKKINIKHKLIMSPKPQAPPPPPPINVTASATATKSSPIKSPITTDDVTDDDNNNNNKNTQQFYNKKIDQEESDENLLILAQSTDNLQNRTNNLLTKFMSFNTGGSGGGNCNTASSSTSSSLFLLQSNRSMDDEENLMIGNLSLNNNNNNNNNTSNFDDGNRQNHRNGVCRVNSTGLNPSSVTSEEELNFNEYNTLLERTELKKGYDFLNNW